MSKAILVLGATGKQGGGVVRALIQHPNFKSEDYTIFAATRNVGSASAEKLSKLSKSVIPVTGDLRKPMDAFASLPDTPKLNAIFMITYPGKTETKDGIATIDEAIKAGARHIVFSSVDRGQGNPATEVPHFMTKHQIEAHLKKVASDSANTDKPITYTIIRPPFFLDNLDPNSGFFGKVFATVWKDRVDRKMTVVDTSDIGTYGAAAILESQSKTYKNTEFDVAGDHLTFQEANEIFKKKVGRDIPTTYGFFVSLMLFMIHDVKKMVEFFNEPGFAASPEQSNKLHHMANFEEWVDRTHAKQK